MAPKAPQRKAPPEFKKKVDMNKVNRPVIKGWITNKLNTLLPRDDDVTIGWCLNLLDEARFPNITNIEAYLAGFLEEQATPFCKELWNLCLSAQENEQGVPQELLQAKMAEIQKEEEQRQKQKAAVAQQDRELDARQQRTQEIRQRDRGHREHSRERRRSRDHQDAPRRRRRDSDELGRNRTHRHSRSRSRSRPRSHSPHRRNQTEQRQRGTDLLDSYEPRYRNGRASRGYGRLSPMRGSRSRSRSRSPPRRRRSPRPDRRSPPRRRRRYSNEDNDYR